MGKAIPGYNMTIIMDTREQKNEAREKRIADFKTLNMEVITERLLYGDYSFFITLDDGKIIDFRRAIVFERKHNVNELVKCLSTRNGLFIAELIRASIDGARLVVMTEDSSYEDIFRHKYNNKVEVQEVFSAIESVRYMYGAEVDWCPSETFALRVAKCFEKVVSAYFDTHDMPTDEKTDIVGYAELILHKMP